MPLNYPDEWRFDDCPYSITSEADSAFLDLIRRIAETSASQKLVFELFKTAFGDGGSSSNTHFAEVDLASATDTARGNAARYIASFWSGVEDSKRRGFAVPSLNRVNKLLAEHNVPLVIEPPELRLREGDITFVKEDAPQESLSLGFVMNEQIGIGGFGTVHRVTRKTKLGEYDYAMKVFNPSSFMIRERAKQRFIRELRTLEKLQHRAIVPLLEAGLTSAEDPYILMPRILGKDLREELAGAEAHRVRDVFEEIINGLRFAHRQGVLHRDLKPKNILVRGSDKQPFILDFGAAFLLDDDDEELTTTLIGTGPYVPDEVHRNPRIRSVQQDVYALGVLLYEVIAQELPVPSDYKPISEQREGFGEVDLFIQRAIAPASKRYKDLWEIWPEWHKFGNSIMPF
jgi:predicted Ser/Thr protein kinase